MTIQLSTGLRNGMLNATGYKEAFTNGVIYLYSGPQPASADAAVAGTLLGKVTLAAGAFAFGTGTNGINMDVPAAGIVSKAAAEAWQMVGIAIGTIGWGRLMGNANDALGISTTLPRFDFSVATVGADLNLSTVSIIVGTPVTVDIFQFTLPPA